MTPDPSELLAQAFCALILATACVIISIFLFKYDLKAAIAALLLGIIFFSFVIWIGNKI